MFLLREQTTEPAANLAMEEALMEEAQATGNSWLRLWRNRPSLIVGRFQCVPAEINLAEARAQGVPVIRRLSGGGTVYHDLGNLNYSLIGPAAAWAEDGFKSLWRPLMEILARRGLTVEAGGRNDLTINGYKFSGAASCRKGGVVLAHACILYDTDLSRMAGLLAASPAKLKPHGVRSVQARVSNLKKWLPPELDLNGLAGELAASFSARPLTASAELSARAHKLKKEKYALWRWNIGSSPGFSHRLERRFPWGGLEVLLTVESALIRAAKIRGDFFGPGPEPVEAALTGVPREPGAIRKALAGLDLGGIFPGASQEEVAGFIAGDIRGRR